MTRQSATETAQDEAGEASDALAASKAEIRRLRTVLSTNDAAAALEESTLKVNHARRMIHEPFVGVFLCSPARRKGGVAFLSAKHPGGVL